MRRFTEVEILKSLDHKNILKFYHSWTTQEKNEMSVNFITEKCTSSINVYARQGGLLRITTRTQWLTLVHFSAQPEPFLTQKHTLNTP